MPHTPSNNSFARVREGFTYDDLLLRPGYSRIHSRKDTCISPDRDRFGEKNILGMNLKTPIIPANMSTISGKEMVTAVCEMGGTATIHRFLSADEYFKEYQSLPLFCQGKVGISLGLNQEWNKQLLDQIVQLDSSFWPSYAIIDIAHGHHERVIDTLRSLREDFPGMFDAKRGVKIVVGNICTQEAVCYYVGKEHENSELYTVHGFKVGVGPGSVCTTRQVTGCGYPQLSAIKAVAYAAGVSNAVDKVIIADGGIRTSGDIVKALAAGAHLVMAGGVFAGTDETPGHKIVSSENFKIVSQGRYQGKMHKRYAGMACYSDDTEVLTENGFKLFCDVSEDEKVATLNQETNKIEYNFPNNKFVYDFNGEMIGFKSGTVDILVTPNHEIYHAKKTRKGYPYKYRKTKAENCFGKNIVVKKDADWNGENVSFFEIPSYNNQKGYSFEMKDWVFFFGFWLAEGSCTRYNVHKKDNHYKYSIEISNNDQEYIMKQKEVLEKYGINCHTRLRGKKYQLSFCSASIWNYLSSFGKAKDKFVPKEIKNMPPDVLEILLESFFKGDGCSNRNVIYSVSKKMIDDFFEIALKVGRTPDVWKIQRAGRLKKIKQKEFVSNYDLHCLYIGSNHKNSFVRKDKSIKEKYTGKVYCLEVPNNILFVRRNGKGCWCGNSKEEHENFFGRHFHAPEGVEHTIECQGPVEDVFKRLNWGIRSGLSYCGCENLEELREYGDSPDNWVRVTPAGFHEGTAHFRR